MDAHLVLHERRAVRTDASVRRPAKGPILAGYRRELSSLVFARPSRYMAMILRWPSAVCSVGHETHQETMSVAD